MAWVFDNTNKSRSAKKSGLKSDKAKLGLLNSALSAIYRIKFKTTNNKNTNYHLVGAFDNEDAPKLLPYQTEEGPFYEDDPTRNFAIFVLYNFQCNEYPMSWQQPFPQIEPSLLTYGQVERPKLSLLTY
ncbi:4665_t:CDS:2 [Gigaspora rosea]|nr:4665_t:CDS:2 [Gigaspora rosea]